MGDASFSRKKFLAGFGREETDSSDGTLLITFRATQWMPCQTWTPGGTTSATTLYGSDSTSLFGWCRASLVEVAALEAVSAVELGWKVEKERRSAKVIFVAGPDLSRALPAPQARKMIKMCLD